MVSIALALLLASVPVPVRSMHVMVVSSMVTSGADGVARVTAVVWSVWHWQWHAGVSTVVLVSGVTRSCVNVYVMMPFS